MRHDRMPVGFRTLFASSNGPGRPSSSSNASGELPAAAIACISVTTGSASRAARQAGHRARGSPEPHVQPRTTSGGFFLSRY
jgi:hypothetical protein